MILVEIFAVCLEIRWAVMENEILEEDTCRPVIVTSEAYVASSSRDIETQNSCHQ